MVILLPHSLIFIYGILRCCARKVELDVHKCAAVSVCRGLCLSVHVPGVSQTRNRLPGVQVSLLLLCSRLLLLRHDPLLQPLPRRFPASHQHAQVRAPPVSRRTTSQATGRHRVSAPRQTPTYWRRVCSRLRCLPECSDLLGESMTAIIPWAYRS